MSLRPVLLNKSGCPKTEETISVINTLYEVYEYVYMPNYDDKIFNAFLEGAEYAEGNPCYPLKIMCIHYFFGIWTIWSAN